MYTKLWNGRCRDRMVVRFISTCTINAYHQWKGMFDTILCDKHCQRQAAGYSTNITARHDITAMQWAISRYMRRSSRDRMVVGYIQSFLSWSLHCLSFSFFHYIFENELFFFHHNIVYSKSPENELNIPITFYHIQ